MKKSFNWRAVGAFLGLSTGVGLVAASEKAGLMDGKYEAAVAEVYLGGVALTTLAGYAAGAKVSGRSEEQHSAPTVPTA